MITLIFLIEHSILCIQHGDLQVQIQPLMWRNSSLSFFSYQSSCRIQKVWSQRTSVLPYPLVFNPFFLLLPVSLNWTHIFTYHFCSYTFEVVHGLIIIYKVKIFLHKLKQWWECFCFISWCPRNVTLNYFSFFKLTKFIAS